ncbi:MAG: DUF2309 domain-containing protein, partial [Caldilineaceae bacterium]|nr:DUF2309 domain-containing protein [Caldilineaceae bacterium]
GVAAPMATLSREQIQAAVKCAGRRIAPLWPLHNFVAVNPFLGLMDQPFDVAMRWMACRDGARMTAPRSFYADAIQEGKITDADLAAALAQHPHLSGAPHTVDGLKQAAWQPSADVLSVLVPTVADIAGTVTGKAWARLMTESISRWAAAHFDQGQAYWPSPWRDLPPYAAWRAEAAIDRTPELAGIPNFRRLVAALPETVEEVIDVALISLAIHQDRLDAYLHRLLLTNSGWAGHARYRLWQADLQGQDDESLDHLLAIHLTWELVLWQAFGESGLSNAWDNAKFESVEGEDQAELQHRLAVDLLLQTALEQAYQRTLLTTLAKPVPQQPDTRRVQAAFCIDVRSEILRRALETVDTGVETIGFAGFFGFPIEYVRLGDTTGSAQCPALLTPQFTIHEAVDDASAGETATIIQKRSFHRQLAKAWRSFKFGAVSCFGFVGPVGLAYVTKLITDSLGKSRPVEAADHFGLTNTVALKLAPLLESEPTGERKTGMTLEEQIHIAAGALTAMSLTRQFAPLVLLVGHGATTVNNPYATGLDCGACGGHTGEANVRVAAKVLNNPAVRDGLRKQGIEIPETTCFLACLHDTTTDQVTILDRQTIPGSHSGDVAQIEASLAAAGRLARAERAPALKLSPEQDVDAAILFRSRDWSQVRPEWGLAGCAALIVAPRERTYGRDLGGRAFLHSYDWRQDRDFTILELIMTAPMVVASWINLQYYGSTVDNQRFGSGNKVLHNVVGTLGVLEGNGGDLRVGLPWQSVHDGENYVHEPLRLSVVIEAPLPAITDVIAHHETVRQLVDHGWLYLFAMDESGQVTYRYQGNLTWASVTVAASTPFLNGQENSGRAQFAVV